MIRRQGTFCTVPLCSLVKPANVTDVEVLRPLVDFVHNRLAGIWPMRLVIGDQGYVQGEVARDMRQNWEVALVVRAKKVMTPPPDCDANGCPRCPWGTRLVWEDYDPIDQRLVYRGDRRACIACALAGTCPKQFEFPAGVHETFWGMVPAHSRLSYRLLRQLRPRIDQGFNIAKNKFRLRDFFLNSRHLTQTLCILCDVLDTLEILAQERPQKGRETKNALLRDIRQPELWDRI